MSSDDRIRIFDSQGEAYKHAFQVFLNHTDQKRNAKRWLQDVVDRLPARTAFIDAGAGNGEVTKAFVATFGRTIAIEPNVHLLSQLRAAVPTAERIGRPIMVAEPPVQGDLVLCSHTFYYIPPEEWLTHLERLVSWMSPTGVTIIVLQNQESGCMNMVRHFFGHRFKLREVADAFRVNHSDRYQIDVVVDPAHVETPDLASTYEVAEFMLNLLDVRKAPSRRDVEAYVQAHFAGSDGGFRIPVHQDFLQIRHKNTDADG